MSRMTRWALHHSLLEGESASQGPAPPAGTAGERPVQVLHLNRQAVAMHKPGLLFVGDEAADHPDPAAAAPMLSFYLKGTADLGPAGAAEGARELARAG